MAITVQALEEVFAEMERAKTIHGEFFNSPHEAYAVILEELGEVWDEIKREDMEKARKEAIQLAGTVLKFIWTLDEFYNHQQ